MNADELAQLVAGDVDTTEGKAVSGLVIIVVFAVLKEIVTLLIKKWLNHGKTAEELVATYQQLGLLRRLQLRRKIRMQLRKQGVTGVAPDQVADALVSRLATLSPAAAQGIVTQIAGPGE